LLLIEQLLELINGVPANHQPFDEQNLPLPARSDGRGELIVQFLLRNDVLQTWTVTADGVRFLKRMLPSVAVQQLVNELGVHVRRNPSNHDAWQRSLSELYDVLFAAVPGVAEASELTVVADGVLSQVPFAALFDKASGRFVFEKAVVRIAPNLAFATRNVYSASPSAPVSAAAIGDPSLLGKGAQSFRRLPHARTETLAVAALYPRSQVAVGSDATKERALDLMARADVVHFAGHAVTTSGAGGARLLLAGDVTNPATALNADDLRARISRPTTVVLAACESAASAREYTTGVSGLSTAFLRAGAASVVATLWKIDDTASEFFFLNVHRGLAAGYSPAESVARAQRACRADQQCRAAVTTWIGTHVYGSN
jgi:CHAT domain-containing protein